MWIGFDGSTAIPEQIGTNSLCYMGSPTYMAWEEDPTLVNRGSQPAFPSESVGDISGRDHITASIAYLGKSQFQLNIKDTTSGQSRTYTVIFTNAPRASAEWIVEDPTSERTGNYWTLPTFQPITFSDCSASVNNVAGSILQNNAETITLTDNNGNTIAASQNLNQARGRIDLESRRPTALLL